MLNSFEISTILESSGLEKDYKPRIRRFWTQNEEYIHVKTSSTSPNTKAVDEAPLVIAPSHTRNRNSIDRIDGIGVIWSEEYFNTNLKSYPKKLNRGKKPTAYGYQVDVWSAEGLRNLLNLLFPEHFKNKIANPLDDIHAVLPSLLETETTRKAIIDARVGQGQFRENLINHWLTCAVTGATNPLLLRASHIKPWKESSNNERLDSFNGLLLSANLDAAFDSGLISFDNSGKIML
ncbi:MAG: hypothetical protein COC10_13400, partial [Sphingobium sp.]